MKALHSVWLYNPSHNTMAQVGVVRRGSVRFPIGVSVPAVGCLRIVSKRGARLGCRSIEVGRPYVGLSGPVHLDVLGDRIPQEVAGPPVLRSGQGVELAAHVRGEADLPGPGVLSRLGVRVDRRPAAGVDCPLY